MELTREIARRFNQFYKLDGAPVFPEPKPLLTPTPKLPGTDGRKMSKSYGNTIMLTDPAPVVRQKLKTMVTDPARVRRTDPGNPDVCPVGDLHKLFSSKDTIAKVYEGWPFGRASDALSAKAGLQIRSSRFLRPCRSVRKKYEDHPRLVWDILEAGAAKAGKVASATMSEVRESMGMSLEYDGSRSPLGAK